MKAPVNFSDKVAYRITMFLRWIADTFLKKGTDTEQLY